jgi:hypothetical protein
MRGQKQAEVGWPHATVPELQTHDAIFEIHGFGDEIDTDCHL